MSRLHYQRTVIGYHGCDQTVAEGILFQGRPFRPSENDYDWLGRGIYFWEYGPERALAWASDAAKRTSARIRTPAVVGAVIHLGECFDLLDLRFTRFLADAFPSFCASMAELGLPLPKNSGVAVDPGFRAVRKLDCAVINWAIETAQHKRQGWFDTVRGMFQEGEPAFPGSEIRARSHVQIAVRNPGCILGVFKPVIDGGASSAKIPM